MATMFETMDARTLPHALRRRRPLPLATGPNPVDRTLLLNLLNAALATAIVSVLRYRHNYCVARGLDAPGTAGGYLVHSYEELRHADQLAERILQLGGEPDFAPEHLPTRSRSQYAGASSLVEMIRHDALAARQSIDSYRALIDFVGETDPATTTLLNGILAVKSAHAARLADLLHGVAALA